MPTEPGPAASAPTVAIMQPYFFPYLGYFQLIGACDVFVLLDDAQFSKNGWTNRNRILLGGAPHWFTLPVAGAPLRSQIRERHYVAGDAPRRRLLGLLDAAYRAAPGYARWREQLGALVEHPDTNVAAYNGHLLRVLATALGLRARVVAASELGGAEGLRGEARVLDLCTRLGAGRYVNSPGGVGLYREAAFRERGIELRFLRPHPAPYRQFDAPFVPSLSIIDVLMFNAPAQVTERLGQHALDLPSTEAPCPG
jgi:hypothetical protein